MYTLVSAIAKSFASNGRWENVDIGDMSLSSIFSTYTQVYAILTNPFITGQVSLDLSQIQAAEGGLLITFNDFLTANGNTSLPTSTTIPTINPQYARYCDAFKAGYKVEPINATAAPDAQLPVSDKTYLYLTKTDNLGNAVNMMPFYQNCMVTVNGYFHQLDADTAGAWVIDGMLSNFVCKQNMIGILDFQDIGTISYLPITSSMIYKQTSNQLYRNGMRINLGQDITNQTVLLVLGGYLHVLDNAVQRIGTDTILIDFNNIPILERFHESMQYLDFSSLPYVHDVNNPALIGVADFLSDTNLVAYATMSQSFFVLLDNSNIFTDYEQLRTGRIVNKLIAYEEPIYPVVNGIGKIADYWSVQEDSQWAISTYDNKWHHRTYLTTDWRNAIKVNQARQSFNTEDHSRAFFMKIGSDLVTNTTPSS